MMRFDLANSHQVVLTPNTGTISMKAVIARGPKGEDGSNVLPTDTAIADAIQNPASETAGALSATTGVLVREEAARHFPPGPTLIDSTGEPERYDSSRPLTPVTTIEAIGHSLMYAAGGVLEAWIAARLGVTCNDKGVGGMTSTDIAIKEGAIIPLLTLSGNALPTGTGSVSVTALLPGGDFRADGSNSTYTFSGTVLGVPCTLTETLTSGTVTWTIARVSGGSAVTVPPGTPFVVTVTGKDRGVFIMNGRNNLYTPAGNMRYCVRDAQAIVDTLTPIQRRYLVLADLTATNEYEGASSYNQTNYREVLRSNTERATVFGDTYFEDVRRTFIDDGLTIANIVATSDDTLALSRDTVPPSLMGVGDTIHPSAPLGYQVLGEIIARAWADRGWAALTNAAPMAVNTLVATPGGGQLALTWRPSFNGGSAITDYVIRYKLTAASTWITLADGTSTTASATITGLVNGQSYDVQVAAVNAVGQSVWSTTVAATPTNADTHVPTTPTGVSATPGDASASVAFTGSTDAVAVVGYRVYSSADGYLTPVGVGASSPINVTGLTNGVAVQFKIAAYNAAGNESAKSSASSSVTPQGVITSDSFNRADGLLTGSTTDCAQGGSPLVWSGPTTDGVRIISNQVGKTVASGFTTATVDAGTPGVHETFVLGARPASGSVLNMWLRRTDANNYNRLRIGASGDLGFGRTVGGVQATTYLIPATNPTAGDVIEVILPLAGGNFVVKVNGTTVMNATEATLFGGSPAPLTGTLFGLEIAAETSGRIDTFKLESA